MGEGTRERPPRLYAWGSREDGPCEGLCLNAIVPSRGDSLNVDAAAGVLLNKWKSRVQDFRVLHVQVAIEEADLPGFVISQERAEHVTFVPIMPLLNPRGRI